MQNMPQSRGDPSTTMDHIEEFVKHALKVNMVHLDSLVELFISTIKYKN